MVGSSLGLGPSPHCMTNLATPITVHVQGVTRDDPRPGGATSADRLCGEATTNALCPGAVMKGNRLISLNRGSRVAQRYWPRNFWKRQV